MTTITKLKKTVLTSFAILCLLSIPSLLSHKTSVEATVDVIYVPTDYPTIQEAINHAESGQTIFVYNGTYYEHVVIGKSVLLIGEDKDLTIIDGEGTGNVISVTANNMNVNGFTIQKSGRGLYDSGIFVDHSSGNNISHNTMKNNHHGIYLYSSTDNVVSGNDVCSNNYHGIYLHSSSNNIVSDNNASSNNNDGICLYSSSDNVVSGNDVCSNNYHGIYLHSSSNNLISGTDASSNNNDGIYLDRSGNNSISSNSAFSNDHHGIYLHASSNNMISSNNLADNDCGIRFDSSSNDNTVYHNNFINNTDQVWTDSVNTWHYDDEGNYWSDYTGRDLNGDGIGDTPYFIDVNNQDNQPLMGMRIDFRVTRKEETYYVAIVCNSTISDFRFEIGGETGNKMLRFNVTGEEGTAGFCRVRVPTRLMNYSYIVLVDREEIIPTLLDASNKTHAYLYFAYVHSDRALTIISSRLLCLYNETLDKYTKLQIDYHNLSSTHYELLDNYDTLLESYQELTQIYGQLLESYTTLNASLQTHLLDYSELQGNHTALLLDHAQNIRNLMYVFAAATAIFIIATVYLSRHAHRRVPGS